MALVAESFWRRLRYTRLQDVLRGQFNGQLDWRSVLAEADLPAEITDTISQVVRKTRLWNGERVDVVQELVAHFQDGQAAGHTAQNLTDKFGDAAQAAKLIQRAKRRGRPLWWRTLHAICWFFGCFLIVYTLFSLYMLTERPTLDTDYLAVLNQRADARALGAPAWPQYRKAMLALGWQNAQPPDLFQIRWRQADITTLLDGTNDDEGNEESPALREFFAEHQSQLAELREATTAPRLDFTIGQSYSPEDTELLGTLALSTTPPDGEPPELISMLLGHVQILNHAGILLAGDALLAVESGDARRAFDNLTACLRVVRHAQNEPFLVSGMVSFAIEWTALDVTEKIFRDHPQLFSDKQLVDLAHRISAIEPPMDYWLDSERLWMFDVMQRIYAKSGRVTHQGALYLGDLRQGINNFDGHIVETERARRILLGVGLPAINVLMASREEQFAMYNKIWQQEQSDCSKPLWELSEKKKRLDELSKSQWDQIRYMPLVLLIPAIDSFRMQLERNAGRREGALIGIALELYRREHGEWPETLKRLSPRWMPEVPIDRINGGSLGYRISEDGVVVYSLGTDTDDDQGQPPVEGPARYRVFTPSPITAETPPHEIRKRDGDWVIWSTSTL